MQFQAVDLIFMDLEFCDATEDGILWLKKIKKQFPDTIVIILTAYENRYKEGFEARAFRFMTKPLSEQELFEYLRVSIEELHLTECISITRRGMTQNILLRDILYISAHFGGSELWTKKDLHFCDESLRYWEEHLPNALFFRCHNKYLVNLAQVTGFANQMATLINGEKIPISRRKWKEFQITYMKYDTQDYKL